MFCPKCGKPDQSPETYCRQCGTFLADFTKKRKQFSLGGDTPHEQIRTNLILNSMSAIVSLASAFILYAVFWNRGSEFPIVFAVSAMLLAVGGWQLSTFFVGLKLRKTMQKGRNEFPAQTEVHQTNPPDQIHSAETKKILPEADSSDLIQPSVTENTTKTLNKIPRR